MELQAWTTITNYHQSFWSNSSVDQLAKFLDDDVVIIHIGRNEKTVGKEAVLQTYRKNFYQITNVGSTILHNYQIQPHPELNSICVSYVLKQTNQKTTFFASVREWFELTPDLKKITKVTMVSYGPKDITTELWENQPLIAQQD